jgi:hypothetical protein
MLVSDSIPALAVGLLDSSGVPCCGEAQVEVRLTVTKVRADGEEETYPLAGFADKDSATGPIGSAMTLEFTNLKLVDRMAVGEFNVTVSTFYGGFPLQYEVFPLSLLPWRSCTCDQMCGQEPPLISVLITLCVQVPLRILPNGIQLLPWGSWSFQIQVLPDTGPWTVHESLPPFRLALLARNVTMSHGKGDKFDVGVRLFRRGDLLDITEASLEGLTIRQVSRLEIWYSKHQHYSIAYQRAAVKEIAHRIKVSA